MTITQFVKGSIGAAAMAMLVAPTAAQAQTSDPGTGYVFDCPDCTTNGQSWAGNGATTYRIYGEGTTIQWEATASAGDFFTFYFSINPDFVYGQPGSTAFGTYQQVGGLPNSRQPINHLLENMIWADGQDYYISATATCTDESAACTARLYPEAGLTQPPTVVPEPMTVVLLGTGLVGIAGLHRRRRAQELEQGV